MAVHIIGTVVFILLFDTNSDIASIYCLTLSENSFGTSHDMQSEKKNSSNGCTIQNLYTNYANLIEQYATSEVNGYTFLNNSSEFQSAVSTLKSHVTSRKNAVLNYLN